MNSRIESICQGRRESTNERGVEILDAGYLFYECRRCADETVVVIVFHDVGYDDLDSLRGYVLDKFQVTSPGSRKECRNCGRRAPLRRLEYFCYHAVDDREIVVRVTPRRFSWAEPTIETYWWDPERGVVKLDQLNEDQTLGFELSTMARRAIVESSNDPADIDKVFAEAKDLFGRVPGHPLLLKAVPTLHQFGRIALSEAISRAHVAAHPEDPEGHAWLGDTIFKIVNHGVFPKKALDEAIQHLTRALELDPTSVQARIGLDNCARLLGKEDQA